MAAPRNVNIERKKKELEKFQFLEPEEIDNRIRQVISNSQTHQKWTEVDLMMRNSVIYDLIGQGLSYRRIVEELCARWGIGTASANTYYVVALKQLRDANELIKDKWADILTERLESIMEKADQAGDRKSYLQATKQLADITGANAPKKVEITNTELELKFN